jgi:hypothetical protein
LGYEYYILLSTTTVYSIKKELKYRYKKEGGYTKAMGAVMFTCNPQCGSRHKGGLP